MHPKYLTLQLYARKMTKNEIQSHYQATKNRQTDQFKGVGKEEKKMVYETGGDEEVWIGGLGIVTKTE